MLRRSPLQRRTPLAAGVAMLRRTPLAQVSPRRIAEAIAAGRPVRPALKSRPHPAVPTDTRAALVARSGGVCEMQLSGCLGRATDPSHRITTGMGGTFGAAKVEHDRLSDLIHACRRCHDWCHARDAESKDLGLRLNRWQDPTAEPVWYRGVLSYLDDFGGVHDFEEVGP